MRAIEGQTADLRQGNFLCLHTGFADLIPSMNKQPDGAVPASSCAVLDGRDERHLNWMADSGMVVICTDNFAVEACPAMPAEGENDPALRFHAHCLFKLGIQLDELWCFAGLAK